MFFPLHDEHNSRIAIVPVVSYGLVILISLVFAYQVMLESGGGVGSARGFVLRHGLVPEPFLTGNPEYSCTVAVKIVEDGEVEHDLRTIDVRNSKLGLLLMPFSYIFLHGSLLHLISNLWFFWIFADNVEERMRSIPFAIFFLLTGAAGGLLHVLLHTDSDTPLIGASGAVAGVMGAYIVLFPGNRVTSYFCPVWFFIRRIDVPAWMVLGFFLLIQSLALMNADTLMSRVAFDAHLGGFVAGMLSALMFRASPHASPDAAGKTSK